MISRKFLAIMFVALMAMVVGPGLSTANMTPERQRYFVRVPSAEMAQVAELSVTALRSYDYGAFQWLELTPEAYAQLERSNVSYTLVADANLVQVTAHRFDPLDGGEPAFAAEMQANGNATGFRLVQLMGPTRGEWLSALEDAGLAVLQYYPHNSFLVWGDAAATEAVASLDFVRWVGLFHPGYKINSDLQKLEGRIDQVDIFFYNDGDIQGTLEAIRALGGSVLQHYAAQPDKAFYDAIVELDASALDAVAKLDTVLWLGYSHPDPVLDDEMSSQIVAGNHPGGVPVVGYNDHLADLGVDGSGVTWAVVDTGVDYAHPDLNGHIVGGYSFPGACDTNPGDDCSNGGHGTHVAGIVGGDATAGYTDGDGFLYGLGMAPEYGIFAMNSLSAPSWPPTGGWQEHSKQAVLGGAIGGNNSWTTGEGTNHGYQASERTHDLMVRDGNFDTADIAEPFIEVFSAGNSGPGANSLTAPKEGKNLIITASSQNFRVGSIDEISSFSSRGPAVDGRWVPTIAAPGEQIASSTRLAGASQCTSVIAGTDGHYSWCSGTSMAAPQTSGAIVLITEWWRGMMEGGADPSPAMAKALLVNGAVDMGTADIPNINEGWGRINVTNVISPSALTLYRDQEMLFTNTGEDYTLEVGIADPSQPLKVTIAWSDAPGAVGANPALVNDLNLTVMTGGETYLGNDFSNGWSTTGGTADSINNLENVYVQNPSGSVVITVDAANISGDGVPYNGEDVDQDFVLVCSNCAERVDFGLSATPRSQAICAPNDALYTVDVSSILGFSDPVTLSATGEPAGTTATFDTNPVTPPGSSILTIGNTGAAAGGSYSIDIVGVAPTSTHTTTVGLDLFVGTPDAPTLVSPSDGAIDVLVDPTFEWTTTANTSSYLLEIASDAAFSDIVYSVMESGTSHTLPSDEILAYATEYYWRVTPENTCGAGTTSDVSSFTTIEVPPIFCSDPSLAIPDNDATGVSDSMTFPSNGQLLDVDISLNTTHTWVGDLTFEVEHNGTTVAIFDRPGVPGSTFGCSGDDIDATLDDEAATSVEDECGGGTPTIQGSFIPNEALSAFDGMQASGDWTITVTDNAGGDTGTLNEWCLIPSLSTEGVMGDVTCDAASNSVDALFILQHVVGTREAADTCPLPEPDTLYEPGCDVSGDNTCNTVDALFVLQCVVGIPNPFCPAGNLVPSGGQVIDPVSLNLGD